MRSEVLDSSGQIDDVQMSLFQAVYSRGQAKPLYADATYYGEITHPTQRLVELLSEIAIRIGGGGGDYLKARAVTRLDQGMGGGKSHACIGAYHLATQPQLLFATELGKQVLKFVQARIGKQIVFDLNTPHVVVLPCDNMTPGAPVKEFDGPADTLYERFLWRLFSGDYTLFQRYQPFWSDKSKIAEALTAINRPILIILDEILDYVGNGLDGAGRSDLVAQDMAFLRAILDVANDVPNVALVAVMIASGNDKTALSGPGRARRDDLNSLLERNGIPATVTEVGDFANILRRRLFDSEPPREVLEATAAEFMPLLSDPKWTKSVWDSISSDWRDDWSANVSACYPFHPMLLSTATDEWSKVTGFQRVRSTIRIFAATVFALQQRGLSGEWVPALIGPGDLPLNDSGVREALLGSGLVEDDRTIANYRSLAEIEISSSAAAGTARLQDVRRDRRSWTAANPRAAERAATYIFVASIVGTLRPGKGRGASAPEIRAASSVPDLKFTLTDADEVVDDLVNPDKGMSAVEIIPGQGNNKPARYFLSTRLTHRMLVNNIRRTILDSERDEIITSTIQRLMTTGPFRETIYVSADLSRAPKDVLSSAGIDRAFVNRLVILDPAQFSLRNGMEQGTLEAIQVAMGLGTGPDAIPVQWASSAVFAVVNTQRRALTRGMAVEFLARQKALAAPEVQNDSDLKQTGIKDLADAKVRFETQVRRSFQHVVYLAQPDPDGSRLIEQLTFEEEHSSALDGTLVWKSLALKDKVFDDGAFSAKSLIHNFREADYGKSLADVRASFYSAPRLPLLFNGDRDLQQAIYQAVIEQTVQIVDSAGERVVVSGAAQVNLTSASLRILHFVPDVKDSDEILNPVGSSAETEKAPVVSAPHTGGGNQNGETSKEVQFSFSFARNLLTDQTAADELTTVFRKMYSSLDDGSTTYIQASIQIVVSPDIAESLGNALNVLEIKSSSRPL